MGFKKGLYYFLGTLLKIWNAIFFAFSACTLYATIVTCLYFGLKWCGVSKSAIGLTIAWFTGFVILYTTIKIIIFFVTMAKKRRMAKDSAINATLENDDPTISTYNPPTTPEAPADITPQGDQQLTNPHPTLSNWLMSRKRRPPVQPQKAGNTTW